MYVLSIKTGNTFLENIVKSVELPTSNMVHWCNNISNRLVSTVNIDFSEYDRIYAIKKYYTLLLSIQCNKYHYPPKDIRKILFSFLVQAEKDFEDDFLKTAFSKATSTLDKYNKCEGFYEFILCLQRKGIVVPLTILTKIYDIVVVNNKSVHMGCAPSA